MVKIYDGMRNNNIEEIIKNLEKVPGINECEYIFIDSLNFPKNTTFLNDKIIVTQNNLQDYLMFEYNSMDKSKNQIKEITELNFKQIVDLMILSNSDYIPNHLEEIMDKDTIVSKDLGNNILYIEDIRNNIYIIITKNEKIVIEGRGLETNIKYYENNT